jgi:hypothetical protein
MPRSLFFILASAITVGGLVVVTWAALQIQRRLSFQAKRLAIASLFIYGIVILLRPSSWSMIDLAVLLGAVGGAILIGGSLGDSGAVVAFLVAAAVVDVVSISFGFSRGIIDRFTEGSNNLLLYLTLVLPIDDRLVPIVGISDLLVGGSAAMALIRIRFRPFAVMGVIAAGFVAALAYGIWQGGAPGLPFIALTVALLVWWHRRQFSRGTE